jgi:hypothetical protein
LGNWCLVGKILGFVVETGVGCLALFLVGLLRCSLRDMLFVGVSRGK